MPITPNRIHDPSHSYLPQHPIPPVQGPDKSCATKTGHIIRYQHEIGALLTRGDDWGEIDVIAIWEPLASRFEASPATRLLYQRKTLGVAAVSGPIAENREKVGRLRDVVREAWQFFLSNEVQSDAWYREAASNQLTDAVLEKIARLDRSFSEGAPDISLSLQDQKELTRSIEWAVEFNPALKAVALSEILI